jgi:hypothetical protein
MNKKQYIIIMAIAAVSGILGGMISLQIFMSESALAENYSAIEANEFNLVDSRGRERAALLLADGERSSLLLLKDERGTNRIIIEVSGYSDTPQICLYSKDGNLVAKFPGGSMITNYVNPVQRVTLETSGKAEMADITLEDINAIIMQLRHNMNKLDELGRYH